MCVLDMVQLGLFGGNQKKQKSMLLVWSKGLQVVPDVPHLNLL